MPRSLQITIVIQDRRSKMYLRGLGDWVEDIAHAAAFPQTAAALDFCLRHDLSNLQILLRFGPSDYDVRIVVGERPRAKTPADSVAAAQLRDSP